MILVDALLFKDPDPDGRKVPDSLDPDTQHCILGKCLSISDAIGRRLRDGDKIRYKVIRGI